MGKTGNEVSGELVPFDLRIADFSTAPITGTNQRAGSERSSPLYNWTNVQWADAWRLASLCRRGTYIGLDPSKIGSKVVIRDVHASREAARHECCFRTVQLTTP